MDESTKPALTENLSFGQRAKKGLAYHLVDSTTLMALTTPIYAAIETKGIDMSNDNSLNARLLAVGLTYGGMGRLFSKGLDISRKLFKIKPETKERIKQIHDASYAAVYNAVICPGFYYAAGERDPEKIAIATGTAVVLGVLLGGPLGYAIDTFRDLTGLHNSKRIPESIRERSPSVKKGLAALVVGVSVAATAAIYSLNH